jgi:hypothetical protein
MDPNIKIKFSRNGVEIGEYKFWEVEVMVKTFKILPTDHYWHEGISQWEPVTKLIALIDIAKEDAEIAKQRRANEIEKRKAAEFKQSNYFNCNCCRHTFEEAEGTLDRFGKGIGIVVLSSVISIYPLSSLTQSYISSNEKPLIMIFGFVSVLLWIIGCGFILSAFVRAPSCPKCGSSNFAKP